MSASKSYNASVLAECPYKSPSRAAKWLKDCKRWDVRPDMRSLPKGTIRQLGLFV